MAGETSSQVNRSGKNSKYCNVCNRKVVNDITCGQCNRAFHPKCVNFEGDSENQEIWLCENCEVIPDEVASEDFSGADPNMQIKFLLREKQLMARLLQEMQEKNIFLTEKVTLLEKELVKSKGSTCTAEKVAAPVVQTPSYASRAKINKQVKMADTVINTDKVNNKNGDGNPHKTETLESHKPEEPFHEVMSKKKKRKLLKSIVGTSSKPNDFTAAPKKSWLFVGKVQNNIRPEQITNYLKEKFPGHFECTLIKNNGYSACFRVSVPFELRDKLEVADIWPKGIFVRRYIFRRGARNYPPE